MVDASYVQLSDGRQIAYQEYGDREGRPVFFFHGWIGSRLDFDQIEGSCDTFANWLQRECMEYTRDGAQPAQP